jgi:hypothetical protein
LEISSQGRNPLRDTHPQHRSPHKGRRLRVVGGLGVATVMRRRPVRDG